jgi:ferrous iron transport protein A
MQLSFNRASAAAPCPAPVGPASRATLSDLRLGETAVIGDIDLPHELAFRLMELGFLPGSIVEAARSAPGGDPRVFRVDGAEIALRSETAARVTIRP